jgi:hypothetical protein
MKVIWKETEEWPPSCGHGVEFHSPNINARGSLLAFLDGYEWYHGSPEEIVIIIRKADLFFDQKFLNRAKILIEQALESGQLKHGKLSPQIQAWFNA